MQNIILGTIFFVFVPAAYLAMIVFMQWYMRSRPRYEVRSLLVVWNVALASFSIIGAARTLPEFVLSLQHGIYYSVCDPRLVVLELAVPNTFKFISVQKNIYVSSHRH